jgi:cyclopropane fatty-acyl-phospholipid synthase-like methyltransferase
MACLPGAVTGSEAERLALAESARLRFEALYERQAPWDVPFPQPALVDLHRDGQIRAPVLDVGCGTGELALFLADAGLDTWGLDVSASAIGMAREKARKRGLPAARFLVGDALALRELGLTFATVVDSGLFHALSDTERPFFVAGLAAVLDPGGLFHFLGFSDREPGTEGPRRLSEADIRATFREGWRIHELREARFRRLSVPMNAMAWCATLERLEECG